MVKMEKNIIQKFEKRTILILSLVSIIFMLLPSSNAEIFLNDPPVADANGPYIDYEGNPVIFDASLSYDPDDDPIFFNWDLDGDGWMDLRFWLDDPTIEYTWWDDYNGIVTVFVSDDHDHVSTDTANVLIYNVDPTIISLDGLSSNPIQIGDTIALTCTFTDPGIFDTHTGYINWGDGIEDIVTISYGTYTFAGSHNYNNPGVYTVTVKVEDDDGGFDIEEFQYIVVYDPSSGGFVTGGGWIISPEGAYVPDPTLTGKATFGFVSKYKKGQSTPAGNTEFQFHIAGLNFHSDEYDWLIIAGSKAIFKGSGTINGESNFGFMLTAIDGNLNEENIDKFRIKIWDKDNDEIIYDNADDESGTELGGGQIVIHNK
jgi:hypothetical protein